MGINIDVKKLTSKELEETWSGPSAWYYNTEKQDWFDSLRHSGDKEFAVQYIFRYCEELNEDSELYRPKDFDKAIEWVNDNIDPAGNRKRLIEALERMRLEENLYFTVSL